MGAPQAEDRLGLCLCRRLRLRTRLSSGRLLLRRTLSEGHNECLRTMIKSGAGVRVQDYFTLKSRLLAPTIFWDSVLSKDPARTGLRIPGRLGDRNVENL